MYPLGLDSMIGGAQECIFLLCIIASSLVILERLGLSLFSLSWFN